MNLTHIVSAACVVGSCHRTTEHSASTHSGRVS